ncbi:hypothetical protein NVV94_05260 [Pseudomonas sp. LS1212]|uniref:hypothetical protein n=1 Tax=Pseudomonas sp. LS1212 TaxID=2972478 RepID=UPI00215D03E9|nr:hypothetical protein [Pseudomonas sp. LS1212]UVJ44992.1 hypothetical protein NVV94_05260 [Pseudomonas sp. LS1212]
MKKGQLLAPRNMTREVLSDADVANLLASGSWVLATIPKKPSAHVINQRNFFRRRLEAGYREFKVLLAEPIFNELRARLLEGETFAELVERLLTESTPDNDKKPIVDIQN